MPQKDDVPGMCPIKGTSTAYIAGAEKTGQYLILTIEAEHPRLDLEGVRKVGRWVCKIVGTS